MTGGPTRDKAVWECALECALRRLKYKDCDKRFGSFACNDCRYYIKKYIDINVDPASIDLYMLQAEKEACEAVLDRKNRRVGWLVALVLIALTIFGFYKQEQEYNRRVTRIEQQYNGRR